jgi:formate hydrogenlyase subunit 6/NADH:ubiquinone oxidoreductase subunit I
MRAHALEDITEKHDEKHSANAAYRVQNGQCEICQACVSWLKALDHENETVLPAHQRRGLVIGRFTTPD